MAILLAFASPEIEIVGLSTVFGNIGVDVTTQNALRLVELAGRPDVPVARGAEKPLLRPFTGKGWHVHGRNGLGEVEFPEPKDRQTSAAPPLSSSTRSWRTRARSRSCRWVP